MDTAGVLKAMIWAHCGPFDARRIHLRTIAGQRRRDVERTSVGGSDVKAWSGHRNTGSC